MKIDVERRKRGLISPQGAFLVSQGFLCQVPANTLADSHILPATTSDHIPQATTPSHPAEQQPSGDGDAGRGQFLTSR